jgi:hypothetical protein
MARQSVSVDIIRIENSSGGLCRWFDVKQGFIAPGERAAFD